MQGSLVGRPLEQFLHPADLQTLTTKLLPDKQLPATGQSYTHAVGDSHSVCAPGDTQP